MTIDKDYLPSQSEEYMNPRQLAYFKNLLMKMKEEIIKHRSGEKVISNNAAYEADMSDNASVESESYTESMTRSIQIKTLRQIDSSLTRIANGEYGYCLESGNKIGLGRLLANPTAVLCIEAQERREKTQKSYKRDADNYDDDMLI